MSATDADIIRRANDLVVELDLERLSEAGERAWRTGGDRSVTAAYWDAKDHAVREIRGLAGDDDADRLLRLSGGIRSDEDLPRSLAEDVLCLAAAMMRSDAEWRATPFEERAKDAAYRALSETAGIVPTSEEHWARFDSATLLDAIAHLAERHAELVRRHTTPDDENGEQFDVPLWRVDEDDARSFLLKMANSRLLV